MKTEVVGMAKRKDVQIKCTVEFTEKSKETETEDRTA